MGYRGSVVKKGTRYPHNNNNNGVGNSTKVNKNLNYQDTTICLCFKFLNPLGSHSGVGVPSPSLQHYCRVCNIQLNSCRQAKIHAEGKKHEKRFEYLKLCIETTGEILQTGIAPGPAVPTVMPGAMTSTQPAQPTQPPAQQQQLTAVTTAAMYGYQQPVSYQPCSPQALTPQQTYYYPQTTFHSMPAQQNHSPVYNTAYHDYMTTAVPPPPPMQPLPATTTLMTIAPPNIAVSTGAQGIMQQQGVLSPSLTSGFSGSGDCKSTDTSSILSAASYSSVGAVATYLPETCFHNSSRKGYMGYTYDNGEYQDGYLYNNNNNNYYIGHVQPVMANMGNCSVMTSDTSDSPKQASHIRGSTSHNCDVCQISFASLAVLENHLKGSRHARKVKSMQVFKQLKESGTKFRIKDGSRGEIRCEVCQVSVNSSQQLQAHLIGHKHRVRASRHGVTPNQAVLSPYSSSATTSELSFIVNKNDKNQQASSSNTVVALDVTPQRKHETLSRHRSSGCLSRHCTSTLSLRRAKSSSALNKIRSRSMNFLTQRNGDTSSSTSSEECDANSRRNVTKHRSKANARPRSFSARVSDGDKKEDLHVTAGENSTLRKSGRKKKIGHEQVQNSGKPGAGVNGQTEQNQKHPLNIINLNNNKNLNKVRSFIPPEHNSNEWKHRRTSVGNTFSDVPMLDVFFERLKPPYNNNNNNNNNNSRNKKNTAQELKV